MALAVPASNDRKRVKVYELKDNDWDDRGTGFCSGQILDVRQRERESCCRRGEDFCVVLCCVVLCVLRERVLTALPVVCLRLREGNFG